MSSLRLKFNPEQIYYILTGGMSLFNAVMFVVLTVYYYSVVGLNPFQLVLVGTVLELSCLLFEVPTGLVADTYSRRLSVILGMFILGGSFIFIGLMHTFVGVLIGQVISGLGYTFLSGATDAWLADEVGEEKVGAIYIRSGQIGRVTSLVGMVINAALASVVIFLPIVVGGVCYLLLGAFLSVYMPETTFQPRRREAGEPAGLPEMFSAFREGAGVIRGRPVLMMLMLVNFFIGAASEGFDRLGDAHLVANFTFPVLGALKPVVWFSLLSIAGTLISLLATELFRRRLETVSRSAPAMARVLLALNTLSAVCVVGFGLAGSFPLAVAVLLLRDAANALLDPLYTAWLVQNSSSRVRATLLSMTGQSNALGQIVGGPGVGWIGSAVSLRAALVAAGLLLSPISFVYARAIRSGRLEPTLAADSPENAAPVEDSASIDSAAG